MNKASDLFDPTILSVEFNILEMFVMLRDLNKCKGINDALDVLNVIRKELDMIKNRFMFCDNKESMHKVVDDCYQIASSLFVGKVAIKCADERIIDKSNQFVYLIYSDYGTKIGKSVKPKNRTKCISTKMPFDINGVDCFRVDDMDNTEKLLHKKYYKNRLNGEWFDLSDKDIEDIKEFLT